jgi:hypothetical protein
LTHRSDSNDADNASTSVRYQGLREDHHSEPQFGSITDTSTTADTTAVNGGWFDYFYILCLFADTFTIDEAVEMLGFGMFQVKLSLLTGLAWVRCSIMSNTIEL